jgi:hypothetical protein
LAIGFLLKIACGSYPTTPGLLPNPSNAFPLSRMAGMSGIKPGEFRNLRTSESGGSAIVCDIEAGGMPGEKPT